MALPPESLRLNSPVAAIQPGHVTLKSGEIVKASHIILAVSEEAAFHLLPESVGEKPKPLVAQPASTLPRAIHSQVDPSYASMEKTEGRSTTLVC